MSSPINILFKPIYLLSQWTCMLPGKREKRWRCLVENLLLVASKLQTISGPRRGIGWLLGLCYFPVSVVLACD
jgi:hypothetical protein